MFFSMILKSDHLRLALILTVLTELRSEQHSKQIKSTKRLVETKLNPERDTQ